MLPDGNAIDQNIRQQRDALEAHKHAPRLPLCRDWQRPLIPRWTAIVALRQLRIGRQPIRAVLCVPRVRNANNIPRRSLNVFPRLLVLVRRNVSLEEFPILKERHSVPCGDMSRRSENQ